MKKNLFAGISGMFLLLVISYAANAQLSSKPEVSKENALFEPVSKNVSVEVDAKNVTGRAVKDLTRNFKTVSDARWFEVRNGFIARFILNDITYQVAYDSKGSRTYTMRTYDETKLPVYIRHIVKSTYYDYNIFLVQEVESVNPLREVERPANALTYVIHLEGQANFINLVVSNGEMDEWQKFTKSK